MNPQAPLFFTEEQNGQRHTVILGIDFWVPAEIQRFFCRSHQATALWNICVPLSRLSLGSTQGPFATSYGRYIHRAEISKYCRQGLLFSESWLLGGHQSDVIHRETYGTLIFLPRWKNLMKNRRINWKRLFKRTGFLERTINNASLFPFFLSFPETKWKIENQYLHLITNKPN